MKAKWMRLAALAAVLFVVATPFAAQPPQQQQPPVSPPPETFAPLNPGQKTCPELVPKGTYTAQTKPRIAVMPFVNTNEAAEKQRFGASVSAMLVTFLKRKSQFVVVERDQKTLEGIAEELKRVGTGQTEQSTDAKVELTAFDALLQGQVTLLGEGKEQRIEVDARLLGMDAKILSVSNKSGSVTERNGLRAVVERLGSDLEQGFLRPYYGSLTVTIPDPTKVRIFLTPILWECAKPDEKPPIELDRTKPQRDDAGYEKWFTAPNVATVNNLLAGWYTIRFERPGYDGIGPNSAANGCLEVAGNYGTPQVVRRTAPECRTQSPNDQYVVEIKPLTIEKWPKAAAPSLTKRAGSLRIMVKREFIDSDYRDASEIPELSSIVESRALALNDERDLTLESESDGGRAEAPKPARLTTTCGSYSFEQAKGGNLVISDYHALPRPEKSKLPIGSYAVSLWAPQYSVAKVDVEVQADVFDQAVMIDLKRAVGSIRVQRNGDAAPTFNLYVEGTETKYKRRIALDFEANKEFLIRGLPLDNYTMYSDLPGFKKWQAMTRLLESDGEKRIKVADQDCVVAQAPDPPVTRPSDPRYVYLIKTQQWLAGRLQPATQGGMRSFFNPNLQDRDDITEMLDNAIKREEFEAKKNDKRRPGAADEPALLVAPSKPRSEGADFNDPFQELRVRLNAVDLLYLSDADTKRIAALPKIAGLIHEYIEKGGAVFALVSSPADYSGMFGAAIPIDTKPVERGELEVRPGSQPGLQIDIKIDSKGKFLFPTVDADKKNPLTDWRVLAYRKKGMKEPVVLERGEADSGGYALVWVDTLSNLEHDTAREALGAAEKRAVAWSQHLMFRRFGPDSPEAKTARDKMNTLVFSVRKEVKAN
jgi:TolB-like protein